MQITTDLMWRIHRAAAERRSSVCGDELPEDISGCPLAAQAAHWAMALGAARLSGSTARPTAPPGLSEAEDSRIRVAVDRIIRPRATMPSPEDRMAVYAVGDTADGMYLDGEIVALDVDLSDEVARLIYTTREPVRIGIAEEGDFWVLCDTGYPVRT